MIRLHVEDRGLKEAMAALKELEHVCSGAIGPNTAELHSKERKDGSPENNAEILEKLTKHFVDYVSLTNKADESRVYQPVADEIVKRMQVALSAQGQGIDQMKGAEIRSAALLDGLKAYMELVVERFQDQLPARGTMRKVSPGYATQRKARFGVAEDVVGIASGDLLDNLASGSVRLTRR